MGMTIVYFLAFDGVLDLVPYECFDSPCSAMASGLFIMKLHPLWAQNIPAR